jgi:hypothetical protein
VVLTEVLSVDEVRATIAQLLFSSTRQPLQETLP